jgi:putative cardiolipin synthase
MPIVKKYNRRLNLFMKHLYLALTLCFTVGCAGLPENNQRIASYHLANTDKTLLAKRVQLAREQRTQTPADSGVLLFVNGVDAFAARSTIVRLAEKSLDVQYYIYHSDESGNLLTAELWAAAERGVRVRVLLDDMDMVDKDRLLRTLNTHPNIEIRLFNPFIRGTNRTAQLVTRFGSVTRRAHNKAMIADNQVAIVGGRNIGDAYFGADPDLAFGDLDVLVSLPAAQAVSDEFDLYWNNKLSYPAEELIVKPSNLSVAQAGDQIAAFIQRESDSEYLERLRNSEFQHVLSSGEIKLDWGEVEVLYDNPDKIVSPRNAQDLHLSPKLAKHINAVNQELLVISPYFVPGELGVALFERLQQNGVQVKIVTNSLASNDVSIVHAGYAKYRKRLLLAGVELYEINKDRLGLGDQDDHAANKHSLSQRLAGSTGSLHAKYFVMDRTKAFIGSFNFDPRSVLENTEIGVVINSPAVAIELAESFDRYINQVAFKVVLVDGDIRWLQYNDEKLERTWLSEPQTSWWQRTVVNMMKLLPVESQL